MVDCDRITYFNINYTQIIAQINSHPVNLCVCRSGTERQCAEERSIKNTSQQDLAALAQSAIWQINEKHYETELRAHGVNQILKYGAAFSGKNVEICMESV